MKKIAIISAALAAFGLGINLVQHDYRTASWCFSTMVWAFLFAEDQL